MTMQVRTAVIAGLMSVASTAAAPLRLVDMRAPRPADQVDVAPVKAAPTFVLMHESREIGRITGFPGEDFFWPTPAQMLEKTPGSGFIAVN
jgi:hypothetical protein